MQLKEDMAKVYEDDKDSDLDVELPRWKVKSRLR
jgi:hypothetical protein